MLGGREVRSAWPPCLCEPHSKLRGVSLARTPLPSCLGSYPLPNPSSHPLCSPCIVLTTSTSAPLPFHQISPSPRLTFSWPGAQTLCCVPCLCYASSSASWGSMKDLRSLNWEGRPHKGHVSTLGSCLLRPVSVCVWGGPGADWTALGPGSRFQAWPVQSRAGVC